MLMRRKLGDAAGVDIQTHVAGHGGGGGHRVTWDGLLVIDVCAATGLKHSEILSPVNVYSREVTLPGEPITSDRFLRAWVCLNCC